MQVIRKEKNLKKNRSKDVDFNPKANKHLPVHVLLCSLNNKEKKEMKEQHTLDKIRISKFLGVKEYVPAPQSL